MASVLTLGLLLTQLWTAPLPFLTAHHGQYQSQNHTGHLNVQSKATYLIGVGKADITGPVVEINFMGYADTKQVGSGLRQRIYCRAFILGSTTDATERVVYLVLDTQSGDTAIRNGILRGVSELGANYSVYTKDNIAVTGTHSHSGPGAWLNYLLPQITSQGFNKESYDAIVNGSVLAIKRAHESLTKGNIFISSIDVDGININRSPYAYLANPEAERDRYSYDVDKTMTLLKFESNVDGVAKPLGALTWFPVHGTSVYQNNTLVTGDNKGVAAHLLEEDMKSQNPDFVAGFSQSNVGDTTPNVLGAYCEDTGLQCRFNDSTCGGKTQGCHGRGPLFQYEDQGTRSAFEIGRRQYAAAKMLFNNEMLGSYLNDTTTSSFHFFANMSEFNFASSGKQARQLSTCSAALGYGFAGGTTDGPGAFDFTQGSNDSNDSPSLKNPLWAAVRNLIHDPSDEQKICQFPKPILLDVGETKKPYDWTPNIVDIQLLRIGHVVMIIAPGEATTMSGRRWRDAISVAASSQLSMSNPWVVIGGPANTYAHYIATEEEYTIQRYEGASTLYGPHTLEAYINLTASHIAYIDSSYKVEQLPQLLPGPSPPDNVNNSYSFILPVVADSSGLLKSFGDVISGPSPTNPYRPGSIPSTVFVGANPRNNLRLEGTFAAIEKVDPHSGRWSPVRTDADWHLVYHWKRTSTILATSQVTIEWEIEPWVEEGIYRMHYYGDSKAAIGGKITAFEGVGPTFIVEGGDSQTKIDLAKM